MAAQNLATAPVLRPARLNAAGRCLHCFGVGCDSARCIDVHARSIWEVCDRCGGTEYVNGHRDPATAAGRCDCIGGLVEASAPGLAEVVELRSQVSGLCAVCDHFHLDGLAVNHEFVPVDRAAPAVVYESWPAGGGAPVRWTGR